MRQPTLTDKFAGRVATIITTFTIKKIIEIWQPGDSTDVKPTLTSILSTLHHPFNYSKDNDIQALMVAEVLNWCTTKAQEEPQAYSAILHRLDRPNMAARQNEEAEQVAHSHIPAFTAAYTAPNRVGGTTVHDIVTIGVTGGRTSFVERMHANIEKAIKAGSIPGLTIADLAGIKKTMESDPSSDTPSPIDQALTSIPGGNLLSVFDEIDVGEIVSAPGMGIILKDAVINMRLKDTEMVEREQKAAREKLGHLKDRPIKEMLALLDFGARSVDEKERAQALRPTDAEDEKSKTRKLLEKLHLAKPSFQKHGVRVEDPEKH